MPTTRLCKIKDLTLDLHNFRTLPQKSELGAIRAIVSANPDWFWALTYSLIEDGYHPTENILTLRKGSDLVVKEGNRRIGALKLIFGLIKRNDVGMPTDISERIKKIDAAWKTANAEVPCAIYAATEATIVDRIVTLTHGKNEKAGRDKWEAVARARHNRDMNAGREHALDLLEAYIKHGRNLTDAQKSRWGGVYPLSVLDEAMKKWAGRFGSSSQKEMVDHYPKKTKHRAALESVLHDIGTNDLTFKELRDGANDVGSTKYGLPAAKTASGASTGTTTQSAASGTGSSAAGTGSGSSSTSTAATGVAAKTKAVATDDPRAVTRALGRFEPVGDGREKLVTLCKEARKLKLKTHPHAFCFVLRSMFELSAKAYCKDYAKTGGPQATKASGEDRALVDVLRDIELHLTKNHTDKARVKTLHGAMAEMAKPNGLLSVTSMNQLVHNPKFSVDEKHICTVFGNIFPLLEAMNS
jgi:hypothetical protein